MAPERIAAQIGAWSRLAFLVGLAVTAVSIVVLTAAAVGGHVPIPNAAYYARHGAWDGAELAASGGLVGLLFSSLRLPITRRRG